jgi:hypothetical protein
MSNRRLTSTPGAKAPHHQRAEAGGLKLTSGVGEVQQQGRVPRRGKPTLPQVSLEGTRKNRARANGPDAAQLTDEQALAAFVHAGVTEPAVRQAVAEAKMRLRRQANPTAVETPERRDVAEVQTQYIGAGADRSKEPEKRALTRIERMHVDGMLSFEEFQAAGVLRNRFLNELGSSEGVGSYDPSSRPSPGWQKADRKAVKILTRNRTNRSRLSDLLFAVAGIVTEEGEKVFDQVLATWIVRATVETVDAPTLGQIGAARTSYIAEKQRQGCGGTVIKEALRRAAAHLGYVRLPEFDEAWSWRVLTSCAK